MILDDYNQIPSSEPSSKLTHKHPNSQKTLKIFRIFVCLTLLTYWTILLIHKKQEIFLTISKFFTLWGLVFASIHFIGSIFKLEENLITNSNFLHFVLTAEFVIFLGYWLIILPTGSVSNDSVFKFFMNLYPHLVIQVFLVIDWILNKAFFLNLRKNLFLHLFVFLLYFVVNFVFVKFFDIVPYKAIRWDGFLDVVLFFFVILQILCVWFFILWCQRFKLEIKEEHRNDKELKKHFLIFK